MHSSVKKVISMVLISLCLCSCAGKDNTVYDESGTKQKNSYAEAFEIVKYDNGDALITIGEQKIAVIAPGGKVPAWAKNMTVVRQPVNNIYVAASSVPDLFDCLGELDKVKFTSTKYDDWSLENVKNAISAGEMAYAGKYSAPDYEMLLSGGCELVIESTMIEHSPEVREKLEGLGLPVITEMSSREAHPLGRLEWIKVYGVLLGCEEKAEELFDEQTAMVEALDANSGDKKAAFFYISNNGYAVVRKSGDYVSKMIEMAGGIYVPQDTGSNENALSTTNMQIEAFYEGARDADIIIYNSTIDGAIASRDELIEKCALLKDFKAVKEDNVWCTDKNLFQQTGSAAGMIKDISIVLNGEEERFDDLSFLHKAA